MKGGRILALSTCAISHFKRCFSINTTHFIAHFMFKEFGTNCLVLTSHWPSNVHQKSSAPMIWYNGESVRLRIRKVIALFFSPSSSVRHSSCIWRHSRMSETFSVTRRNWSCVISSGYRTVRELFLQCNVNGLKWNDDVQFIGSYANPLLCNVPPPTTVTNIYNDWWWHVFSNDPRLPKIRQGIS